MKITMEPVAVKPTARNKVRSQKEIVPNTNDVPPNIMAIPVQPKDHLTVERERWKIHDDSNHYEKIKLSMGPSCLKKGCLSHGIIAILSMLIIFILLILANTIRKVDNLEIQMIRVEKQIINNINSIKDHHNSTFNQLERKHDELRDIVNNNSLLLHSAGNTIGETSFEIQMLSATLCITYFLSRKNNVIQSNF